MGLDALPHGQMAAAAVECGGQQHGYGGAASPASLRRSASERVPRDPAQFRFVDPSFFERPPAAASPLLPPHRVPSTAASSPAAAAEEAAAVAAMRRAPDPAIPRTFQRRSRFDAHEVFPDPAKRAADPASGGVAHHGEIALYGEIERRLRKRGIAEPARDLETLKQILEALQLKGLLHHTAPPPPPPALAHTPPPPIVIMRPSTRAPPPPQMSQPPRLTPARRLRVDVDRARRPRWPDLAAASPARSPASPARRGSLSPQRRVSPAQSPKQQQQSPQSPFRKPSGFDSAGARSRIARRAAHNASAMSPDDEASTTFSDGGSSSSLSASSRWDFDPQPDPRTDRALLERCGKLLSSIQAFTGGDAAGTDQQPSPVSVLDAAAFLADEDSPSSSSGSKRAIDFRTSSVGRPNAPTAAAAATVSDAEDDEWAPSPWSVDPEAWSSDPDYAYVAELVRLLGGGASRARRRDPAEVYKALEQQRTRQRGNGGGDPDTWHHRRLLCGAVAEALERQRAACPWDPPAWLRGAELVAHVWAELRRAGEPVVAHAAEDAADLNDVTCSAIRRDLAADSRWSGSERRNGAEVADAVLQIERLVFKELVADTIRELADADRPLPRRKLVF